VSEVPAARRLASALEPFAASVYFAPECHAAYEALGFGPSPGQAGDVHLPDGPAYFCSRGSVMGQVPGEVIASAFAVFNPAVVVPAVTYGWTLTDAPTICAARTTGATAQLVRILGEQPDGLERATELLARAVEPLRPEGRPLFAGLKSLGLPETPVGDAWRLADCLREYRGDCHTAAWTTAGFDATEIGLITEPYWGVPLRSYVRTRAWSHEELEDAHRRLEARALLEGDTLTDAGRSAREGVEEATDRGCQPALDALGDDLEELLAIVGPWGAAIREAGGYLSGGPHDLAAAASRR
jgi:helix-turn-helix protein